MTYMITKTINFTKICVSVIMPDTPGETRYADHIEELARKLTTVEALRKLKKLYPRVTFVSQSVKVLHYQKTFRLSISKFLLYATEIKPC